MASDWRAAVISKRLWLVALAFVALPILAEFSARLIVSRQLFEEEARLRREIDAEQTRGQFLTRYEQYVRTDAYVEWWARGARMALGGEVAVVPVTPSESDAPVARPVAASPPRHYPSEWWAAFFAGSP